MKPLLTIAIPTFNNYQQLLWCLKSLIMYTDYPYEVIIVNNGDDGGLESAVETSDFSRIRVIKPESNIGWMGGINRALGETTTRFFCMVNDDVVFLPGQATFWRTLIDGTDWSVYGAAGPCSNYVAGSQSLMEIDVPLEAEVSLLIGVCLVMETDLLKALGGLDEKLPGGDDLDLSIRIRKMGKGLLLHRTCYIHHHGQQTGRRVFGEYYDSQDMQERSNNALIRKHGVRWWYSTFLAQWKHVERVESIRSSADTGEKWRKEQLCRLVGSGAVGMSLGCGHEKRQMERCWGLDLSRPGESGAGGRKFFGASPDVVGDAMRVPALQGSLDYLVVSHLFEHLVDPLEALEEWRRVLRPGGVVLLLMPDHDCSPTMIIDYTHVHAYTVGSLSRLIGAAPGWEMVSCEGDKPWGTMRAVVMKTGMKISDQLEEGEFDYGEIAA